MKIGDPVEFDLGNGQVLKGTVTWMEADPFKEFRIRASFNVPIDGEQLFCTEGFSE